MEEKLVALNIRVPHTLKKLIKKYVSLDTHKDISEFTRDAIREKIQRDAPHLYKQIFKEKQKNDNTSDPEIIRAKKCERFLLAAEGEGFTSAVR